MATPPSRNEAVGRTATIYRTAANTPIIGITGKCGDSKFTFESSDRIPVNSDSRHAIQEFCLFLPADFKLPHFASPFNSFPKKINVNIRLTHYNDATRYYSVLPAAFGERFLDLDQSLSDTRFEVETRQEEIE
ncbi:hypothetical protein [Brucella sp. IR073]|uniref:hypothetical protein n=1 Tax=unclassified Brucella TaxID=2632610 RepID=UPI003B97D4D2